MAKRTPKSKAWKRLGECSCPYCLDGNRLGPDGRPAYHHGMMLTGGCDLCRGTGRASLMLLLEYPGGEWAMGSNGVAVPV